MRILQVNRDDRRGGAANIAFQLHGAHRRHGYNAWLAVANRDSQAAGIHLITDDCYRTRWASMWRQASTLLAPFAKHSRQAERLQNLIAYVGQPAQLRAKLVGHEEFDFPGTWHLLDLPPQRPDLLHLHNLHNHYFDLRALPWLSHQVPTLLTLHDAWLLAGHCVHSFDCRRWQTGCGSCPDLNIYPHLLRDRTAYNWQRKRTIYAESRLYVTTPSTWLMKQVEASMLAAGVIEGRVIPNGVDQTVFLPGDQAVARAALDIAPDTLTLLFTANGGRKNQWKDFQTLRTAVALTAEQLPERALLFLALGESAEPEQVGSAQIRFVPYCDDPQAVAQYYQAADLYLHAAKADTFPTTVLEALSCGTPVIATAVGGIPEQIEEGVTGFLVPQGDSCAMADRILRLLTTHSLRRSMARNSVQSARQRFSADRMHNDYLTWYAESIRDWTERAARQS